MIEFQSSPLNTISNTCTNTNGTKGQTSSQKRIDPPSQEEYNGCPICFEQWTTLGDHRMASLKCGHIFGLLCIEQWLRNGKRSSCPQCNECAKKSDIRLLFAPTNLKIDDNSMKKKLEGKISTLEDEIELLNSELMKVKLSLKDKEIIILENLSKKNHKEKVTFLPFKDGGIKLSLNGESRHMTFCDYSKLLLITITTRSSNCTNKKSSGVVRVNLFSLEKDHLVYDFLPLHDGTLKGLCFSPHSDGLLLSCGLDSKLILSDPSKSSILLQYFLPAPPWSCAWDPIERNYCWAGLSDGSLMLYDLRSIKEIKKSFSFLLKNNPIQSITFINGNDGIRNIILGTLKGPYLMKILDDSFLKYEINPYTPHSMIDSSIIGRWGLLETKSNADSHIYTLASLRNPTENVIYKYCPNSPILISRIPSIEDKSLTLSKGDIWFNSVDKIMLIATPDGKNVRISSYELIISEKYPTLQYLLLTDMKTNVVSITLISYAEDIIMFVLNEIECKMFSLTGGNRSS